jgi:peptide-methionine (S)-S-oxide reductase
VVLVVYDPTQISLDVILKSFWEQHDPTTLNRQGNDRGTQYRSAIYWTTEEQRDVAVGSKDAYQRGLTESGFGSITTEIAQAGPFYYAEEYHQQYLFKNPGGYCNHGFCQIEYPADMSQEVAE